MSNETVTVGCKWPQGVILQVGDASFAVNGANSSSVYGGHGITSDVPKDLWDAWVAENKNGDLYRKGYIFANEKRSEVKAEAKEKVNNKTKAEPLDPNDKRHGVTKAEF